MLGYNRFGYGYGGYGYPYYGYGGYGGYGYPYYGNGGYATSYYSNSSSYNPTYVAAPSSEPVVAAGTSTQVDYELQGENQFKSADYAGAARSWQHALVDTPDNGTLYLMISQALFATGKFDEAAGALQLGLMQIPEAQWGVIVENARELYGPNQDYANQVKALEKSSNENPSAPAQQLLLGYHFGYLGFPVQAVEKLNRAMQLAPQDLLAQKLREIMAAKATAKGETVQPAPMLPKQDLQLPSPSPAAQGPNTNFGPGTPSLDVVPLK